MSWLTHGLLQNGLFLNQFGLGSSGGGIRRRCVSGYQRVGGQTIQRIDWACRMRTSAAASRVASAHRGATTSPHIGIQRLRPRRAADGQSPGGGPVSAGNWRTFGSPGGGGPYRGQNPGTNGGMSYRQETLAPYQPAGSYRGYSASAAPGPALCKQVLRIEALGRRRPFLGTEIAQFQSSKILRAQGLVPLPTPQRDIPAGAGKGTGISPD